MKSQRTMVILLLLVVIIAFSSGFDKIIRGRTEIENLYPILAVGVDKNSNPDEPYRITTVSPTTEAEAQKTSNIMTATGESIFEANRSIGMYAENDIFWGHTDYLLIGEEAAKDDVNKYMDFFARDNEPRSTIMPIIVKDYTSQEVISLLYEQNIDISSSLDKIMDNAGLTSFYRPINLLEYYNMAWVNGDGYLPYISMEKETPELRIEQGSEKAVPGQFQKMQKSGVDKENNVMYIHGYALIKDGKVVDYIQHEQARGLNWLVNEINSGVVIINYEGASFNLEITHGSSQIVPKIEGDTLSAEVRIQVETNITEIDKQGINVSDELVNGLKDRLGKMIKRETEQAIEITQKHEIDIFGLGDQFNRKYPVKWQKEIEEQWEELFPNVEINVMVEPIVGRSSISNQSIMEEGK